jgi:molybdate transport repressor ModE-like protein
MLSLDRLKVLGAVARHGSVTRAAAALHLSTSAVSQQISKLEHETGQRMLERQGRGVRLTPAGELLVSHAEPILALLERAEADLEGHRGAVAGHLTLAAFATAARGLAPAALRALHREHSELVVELHELEPDDAIDRVGRGDVDVAVVQDWANAPLALPDRLRRAPLLDDVVDIALDAEHPLASRKSVEFDEIADEPWISWTSGFVCHDWLVHTMRTRGFEPRIAHQASEHQTQLALVAAGLGVAVVPRLGREPLPDGVVFVPVRPTFVRHVYAIWRENSARRLAINATVGALEAAVRTPHLSDA